MKKSIVLLAAVSIAMSPVFTTFAATHASSKKINLTFSWWGNTSRDKLTENAIRAFETLHPNIHITPEFNGSFSDYFNKLAIEAAGGNAPDIMQMDYDYINSFGQRGALLNMSHIGINTANISKSILQDGVMGGKEYGIPNSLNTLSLIYNTQLLKRAGIPVTATTRWTWGQFASVLNKIHHKLGIYGTDDPLNDTGNYDDVRYYVRQHNEHTYNASQKGVGYKAATLANWYGLWTNLKSSGAVPPATVMMAHPMSKPTDLFLVGKAAMILYWSNFYQSLHQITTEPLGLLLPPTLPGGKEGLYIKPSQYWSISAQTKYPKQSAEFVNFLLNSLQANDDLGLDRGIPVSNVVRADMNKNANAITRVEFAYIDRVLALNPMPMGSPPPEANDQVIAAANTIDAEVTFNQLTPKVAAQQLITQVNHILG